MASIAARFGKKMVVTSMGLGQTRGFATPTAPRLKSFAATAEDMLHKPKNINVKAEFVPVCVMAGMVVMATLFGVHTAKQQLLHSPNVHLRKKKREIVPEVYQPEQVLEESDKYLHNSFFRRVAHIQDHSPNPVPDTIHGNALLSDMRSETLKSVGIEP